MLPAATDWKARYPILREKTYLCSHSLGAVPASTADALREYYDAWATMGIAAWEGPWWATVMGFCKDIEALLRAKPGSVCPTQNATRAMAGVASCLDYRQGRRKVVMTELEFTTFYPFWRGQERLGAELVIVPSADKISVPLEDVVAAIDNETLLVATCHAFFRSGAVQDLRAITDAAHRVGALVLGDGYQTVGSHPVDMGRLDVDFYVGGSHKYLCGGAGAGYLYVRPDLIPKMRPRLTGWFGLQDPFAYQKDTSGAGTHEGVLRFQDGTPNVPALYSAREGIRGVKAAGADAIRSHSLRLTGAAMKQADERGLEVRTPRREAERSGMLCLQFEGSQAATKALVARGIVVDWRPDCGLRMSPHFYNAAADVDRFFEALDGIRMAPRAAKGPKRGR